MLNWEEICAWDPIENGNIEIVQLLNVRIEDGSFEIECTPHCGRSLNQRIHSARVTGNRASPRRSGTGRTSRRVLSWGWKDGDSGSSRKNDNA